MKKSKRAVSLLLGTILALSSAFGGFTAFAKPANSNSKKNPAWLSGFYVRETSTDFAKKDMVPHTDKAYSKNYTQFYAEVQTIEKECGVTLESLKKRFDDVIIKLYDMISKTELLKSYEEMKDYLENERGIVYPEEQLSTTPVYTAVLYACLKYDFIQPITGRPLVVPEGTTLERGIAIVVANVLDEDLPDDIDSLEEFAVESLKNFLEKNGYDVPEKATPTQIVLMYKIMTAEQQGYNIENHEVENYTQADIDNLNGNYYAAIVTSHFGIKMDPKKTFNAVNAKDTEKFAVLILTTMIESKKESVKNDTTPEMLFDHACKLGFFNLKNGFYPDVYDYDVYLNYKCSEVWLSAYASANENGQEDLNNLKLTMNGAEIFSGKSYLLKLTGNVTAVVVQSKYNNGKTQGEASYTFRIHNGTKKIPADLKPEKPKTENNIPNITIPNIDSNGAYTPLPENTPFNPYEVPNNGTENLEGIGEYLMQGNVRENDDSASQTSDKGTTSLSWWVIALSVTGGVFVGGVGVVGVWFLIKKKEKTLFGNKNG